MSHLRKLVPTLIVAAFTSAFSPSQTPPAGSGQTQPSQPDRQIHSMSQSQAEAAFRATDANSDGYVSAAELERKLLSGSDKPAGARSLLAFVDADRDGRLSLDEYVRLMPSPATPPEPRR